MSRVAVYDPAVFDPFAAVFPSLLRSFYQPVSAEREAVDIRMDVTESADAYVVQAEVPGVSKDEIQVQIDGNKVRIAAEVKRNVAVKAPTEPQAGVLCSERYFGAMARSFAVASEIDEEKASAKFENGVLTLNLPKKAVAPAKRLAIH